MKYSKSAATFVMAAIILVSIGGLLPIDLATLMVTGLIGAWEILAEK